MTKLLYFLLKPVIIRVLSNYIPQIIINLDPKKHYLLVLPEDLDSQEVYNALQPLAGTINLLVLQANGIKIIEVD